MSAFGSDTVTVRISSDTDPSVNAEATLNLVTASQTPIADAGGDRQASLGQLVQLDGSGSSDPDGLPSPLGYALANGDIANATAIQASFTPDAAGQYVLRLDVSDGEDTASDNVLIEAQQGLSPIGDLYGRGKPGRIDLIWSPMPDAVSYDIYRRTDGAYGLYAPDHPTSLPAFADRSVTHDLMHCYVVRWRAADGAASGDSNEVCVTPTARPRR